MSSFLLKIRRGETPFYRALRNAALVVLNANLPVPSSLKPFLRLLYSIHFGVLDLVQGTINFFYREPLFRARCESVGGHLRLTRIPEVYGHTLIHLGDRVSFNGHAVIASARFLDQPTLIIKDRAIIGDKAFISVNQEIVIEEDVMIANNCAITDNDGHSRAMDLRIQHAPLTARDIRPVRIRRGAWLGRGVQVMKGVTIGEGAIISAHSVVISDIPAYALAMGNPAEVVMRGAGKPSKRPDRPAVPNPQPAQRISVAPQE
jgi:acetyltransferase-like isoleucine patch superfamily enzyme